MKSNKSYLKRLRVTKTGKIVSRVPGQNHFNAKASGSKRQQKKRVQGLNVPLTASDKSRFFPRA